MPAQIEAEQARWFAGDAATMSRHLDLLEV
jgi:hypothetical protein